MPCSRCHTVIDRAEDDRVHRVHAHQGSQLQQTLLAIPSPYRAERLVADLAHVEQLPPEANDQRLVCGERIQWAVCVDCIDRLLARAGLQS